jgi:hypothetical protein
MEPIFDHEKLDVYGLELQFVAWTTDFLQEVSVRLNDGSGNFSPFSIRDRTSSSTRIESRADTSSLVFP